MSIPLGRRQAGGRDDDDIPFLPNLVRSRALGLRGGPFDDGIKKMR